MGCCCSKTEEETPEQPPEQPTRGILKPTRTFERKKEAETTTRKISSSSFWRDPIDAKKVLSFWFGAEEYFETPKRTIMFTKEYSSKRSAELWYSGSKEADERCKEALQSQVGVAQKEKLTDEHLATRFKATAKLDAIFARVILLDQVSRNVFRGTEKAFAGDECALRYAKCIVREGLGDDLPPSALGFVVSPFLHSELLDDHVIAEKFTRTMIEKNGANSGPLEWTLKYVLEHKEVLEMFGRYPHRNEVLGRENTSEEEAWLQSAVVPGWAKSQKKK